MLQQDARHEGRPLNGDLAGKWQLQQATEFSQADKFARDLDMLLPIDLDWAMNLSSNEGEDLRNCHTL